jgi:hypothetical protein
VKDFTDLLYKNKIITTERPVPVNPWTIPKEIYEGLEDEEYD